MHKNVGSILYIVAQNVGSVLYMSPRLERYADLFANLHSTLTEQISEGVQVFHFQNYLLTISC